MFRRPNPWPALVDLFAALLIAAFAGFILMAAEYRNEQERSLGVVQAIQRQRDDYKGQLDEYVKRDKAITRVREQADEIIDKLGQALVVDERLRGRVRKCGEDACIDLFIHYPRNGDEIPENEQANQLAALRDACQQLRQALDRLPPTQRDDIEVVVEGHADRTQVKRVADPRMAYLYNWNLSARRAGALLFEFQRCGLTAPHYSVAMIGYADSEKVCAEPTDDCDRANRRTTLRLRIDTRKIARELQQQPANP